MSWKQHNVSLFLGGNLLGSHCGHVYSGFLVISLDVRRWASLSVIRQASTRECDLIRCNKQNWCLGNCCPSGFVEQPYTSAQ